LGVDFLRFTPQLVTPQRFPFENPKTILPLTRGQKYLLQEEELEISQQEAYFEFVKKGH